MVGSGASFARGVYCMQAVTRREPMRRITMQPSYTLVSLSSPMIYFSQQSCVSGIKQKTESQRALPGCFRKAPRVSNPSEKLRLAIDIYHSCFFTSYADTLSPSGISVCECNSLFILASVSKVRHCRAVRMMAEVRDEMKLIMKMPECHLI